MERVDPLGDEKLAHDLPRLSRELGVNLPSGVTVLWAERQEGLDDMTRAKLEMSRATFDRLTPTMPIRLEALAPSKSRLGSNHAGWDPHANRGLLSGQVELDGGRVFELGYAEHDSMVTVYLVNFGT